MRTCVHNPKVVFVHGFTKRCSRNYLRPHLTRSFWASAQRRAERFISDYRLPLVSASLTLLVKPFINLDVVACEGTCPIKPQAKQRSTPLHLPVMQVKNSFNQQSLRLLYPEIGKLMARTADTNPPASIATRSQS